LHFIGLIVFGVFLNMCTEDGSTKSLGTNSFGKGIDLS